MDDELQRLIGVLRKTIPDQIASEICGVQPMPKDAFKNLYEAVLKAEEEMIAKHRGESEKERITRVNTKAWETMQNQLKGQT